MNPQDQIQNREVTATQGDLISRLHELLLTLNTLEAQQSVLNEEAIFENNIHKSFFAVLKCLWRELRPFFSLEEEKTISPLIWKIETMPCGYEQTYPSGSCGSIKPINYVDKQKKLDYWRALYDLENNLRCVMRKNKLMIKEQDKKIQMR